MGVFQTTKKIFLVHSSFHAVECNSLVAYGAANGSSSLMRA